MAEAYRLGIIQLMQILIFGLCLSLWFLFPPKIASVYDPLSVSNNRFGIHILDPIEVEQAAKLVNSNGGKWGNKNHKLKHNPKIKICINCIIPNLYASAI